MSRSTLYTPPIERFILYAKMFPRDRFDPNILMVTDGMGVVSAVGPLGLVYLSSLGQFEIKKKQIVLKTGNKKYFKGKSLYRNQEWGYHAIALYWSLPSAKIVESVLHPDYYSGIMTIDKIIDRIEKMLRRYLRTGVKERHAKFFKWFDKAFKHVDYKEHRDVYQTQHCVISSKPQEYGFFPYAFRKVENISLRDYYERKNNSTG